MSVFVQIVFIDLVPAGVREGAERADASGARAGLSVAFMVFAATLIARLLKRYPWIAWLGLTLILWVALAMMWEGAGEFIVAAA